MDFLGRQQIPVFNYPAGELVRDLANAEQRDRDRHELPDRSGNRRTTRFAVRHLRTIDHSAGQLNDYAGLGH
jgi:hypothetical protein